MRPETTTRTDGHWLDQRAGDADREKSIDLLRLAAGDGQLEVEELEQRLEAVAAARTHGELRALTRDLSTRDLRAPGRRRYPLWLRIEARAFWAVSLLMIAIWALTGLGYFWPVWPILGWGSALAIRSSLFSCSPRLRRHGRAVSGPGCGPTRRPA